MSISASTKSWQLAPAATTILVSPAWRRCLQQAQNLAGFSVCTRSAAGAGVDTLRIGGKEDRVADEMGTAIRA